MAESGDSMKEQQPTEAVSSPSKREVFQKGWDALKQRVTKPFKDSLGLGSRYPTYRQMDRREFLKEGAAVVGTAVALTSFFGGSFYKIWKDHRDSPEGRAEYDAYPKPEGLPGDILSKWELGNAGITIWQTPDVQLYIRRGALEIPIFKDAKDKKINGLTISLVDHDRLSWNSINKLPAKVKEAWQDLNPHPGRWSESYWSDLSKYFQDKIKWISETQELESQILDLEEQIMNIDVQRVELLIRAGADPEEATKIKENAEKLIKDLKEIRLKQTEAYSKKEQQLNELLNVSKGPRDKAIEYFAENTADDEEILGQILRPNATNKMQAFVYICIGKDRKPNPDQSFPSPDWFTATKEDGPMYPKHPGGDSSGFTLRHELGHYEGKRQYKDNSKQERENEADRIAYKGILEAWQKYQETGDTSGYPFVFVTKEGITITKNLAGKQPVKAV